MRSAHSAGGITIQEEISISVFDELEESVLLLVFVIQRQNEGYFCVVFGLATFTDCTPGGLIPEILNTNTIQIQIQLQLKTLELLESCYV